MRVVALAISLAGIAGAASAAEPVDFVHDIRPIFEQHCYECHAGDVRKSGLRLDIKSEAFRGGELYGAAIIAGRPEESPLWQFIADDSADLVMPPEAVGPSEQEISKLRRWIEQGATWPDGVDTVTLDDPRDHWSFKPIRTDPPPVTRNVQWPRNDVDRFILARLEQEGLAPAPPADRAAWLRRVTFDLIGLPPTPQEVDAFVNDRREDAYERVVERLLASPRYGERWAQHWLDVVRYADTHGFEVNTERPNAWPYRDYVIESLNQDKPYDQFVREQIAGDTLGADAATGFLVTASVLLPGQIGKDEASIRLARQDALDEIVTNVGTTFLGLTIHCARCHNHKFDPVSHREYYEMQAFVAGVEYQDREFEIPMGEMPREQRKQWTTRQQENAAELVRLTPLASSGRPRARINSFENIDRFEAVQTTAVRFRIEATNKYETCLDELEVFNTKGTNVALAAHGATVTASGSKEQPNRHELRFVNDGKYGNSRSWMADSSAGGWVVIEFPEFESIDHVVWGRDRQGKFNDRLATSYTIEIRDESGQWQPVASSADREPFDLKKNAHAPLDVTLLEPDQAERAQALLQEKSDLAAKLRSLEDAHTVFAGKFREPDEIRVLGRGSPELPKEKVAPGVPEILGEVELPPDASESARRRALAEWIVRPDNPLTARVMANRIWQGHFGMGLVETANDFGRNGVPPSHPELLDWLSAEFHRGGWSLKHMHRLIVLSATYRQSTQFNPAAAEIDADGRLLWRYPTRRMMGEGIRDSILAVSGSLNLEMGGPGFSLFDKRGGLSGFNPIESFNKDGKRRMIYSHRVRRERDAVFGAFDCPDFGQSTPGRRASTTSIQALNLFNSRFVIEQSRELAEQLEASANDRRQQIQEAYRRVLNRLPDDDEIANAEPVVAEYGLSALCRALFNCNEFLFIP